MLPFVTNQPKPFKWFWNYKHRIVFFTLFIKNLLLALTKMQSFRDFCSCPLKEMTCFLLYKLRIDLAQSVPFSPMFRLFRNFPTVLFALIWTICHYSLPPSYRMGLEPISLSELPKATHHRASRWKGYKNASHCLIQPSLDSTHIG